MNVATTGLDRAVARVGIAVDPIPISRSGMCVLCQARVRTCHLAGPVTIGDGALLAAWFDGDTDGAANLSFYQDVRAWLKLLAADRLGWIAHADGHPVGFLDLEMSGDAGYFSLYVVPGSRRRGYGAALLRIVAAKCGQRGDRRAVGAVEPGNTASVTALRRAGFTVSAQPDDEGMLIATAILPGR